MNKIEIPDNYSGIVNLYMSSDGLEIEKETLSKPSLESILVFLCEYGEMLARYIEKYDEKEAIIYSYHYN